MSAVRFLQSHLWAMFAIVLGVWEGTAYGSRRRIPTVSAAVWAAQRRRKRTTAALVGCWLIGLGRHLLRPPLT